MLSRSRRSRRTAVVAAVGVLVVSGGAVGAAPAGAAVRFCQGQQVTIEATASDTTINGTPGPDVIDGIGRVRLVINGLGGDDVICTGPGDSVVVHGGDGDDSLQSDVVGGEGTPTELYGEGGDDTLRVAGDPTKGDTSNGNPVLAVGGEGNDQFTVVAGGRAGDLVPGPGDDVITGTGSARVFFGGTAGVRIDVPAGTADGEGHDTFTGVHRFVGSPGPDTFIGSDEDDTFGPPYAPGSDQGTDTATGGGGDDLLTVQRGSVDGGAGDDVLSVGDGSVSGGPGDDWIEAADSGIARGGAGDDVLRVSRHQDRREGVLRLFGDAGNDRVDLVYVGKGWATACTSTAACLTDIDGGSGRDLVTFKTRAGVSADLRAGRARYGSARTWLRAIEDLRGTAYADTLQGDARANRLEGLGGADVLRGRAGADRLIGGAGRDRVDGGPGRDRCQGEVRRSC